jgi:hypothetical protein
MVLALNYRTMATVISKSLLIVCDLKKGDSACTTGAAPVEESFQERHAINSFYNFRRIAIPSHFLALI